MELREVSQLGVRHNGYVAPRARQAGNDDELPGYWLPEGEYRQQAAKTENKETHMLKHIAKGVIWVLHAHANIQSKPH